MSFLLRASSLAALVAIAVLTVSIARATATPLDYRECIPQIECGAASAGCWPPGHVWGSASCQYCSGSQKQDLCVKVDTGVCLYIGSNQNCGSVQSAGTCTAGTGGGTCTGGTPTNILCTVPKC